MLRHCTYIRGLDTAKVHRPCKQTSWLVKMHPQACWGVGQCLLGAPLKGASFNKGQGHKAGAHDPHPRH